MSEHIIVNGYFNSLSDVENDTFILSVRNDHRLYPSIVVNAMDNYNEEVENFLFNFSDDDNVLSHIGGGIYSLTNKAYSILQEYDDKDFDNEEVENAFESEIKDVIDELIKLSDELYDNEEKQLIEILKNSNGLTDIEIFE